MQQTVWLYKSMFNSASRVHANKNKAFQVCLSSQTTGRGNRERNCTFRTSIHSPFVAVGGEEVRYFTPFLCLAVFFPGGSKRQG